ncbi:MAG: peptidylprolyl isomerase [Lentisphaeria bacterium]|jgi:cyclophilin family peptidyl-prolyl cis-trans isomerase|nr:peptidylprolyl isomerase [Lentisphaeria bacterium]
MKFPHVLLLLLVLFGLVSALRAEDTLVLHSGTVHQGKVIVRGNTYTVLAGKRLFQFQRHEVKELNGEAVKTGNPLALLRTDAGDLKVELFEDEAPNTVANFVTLAEAGFYKGQSFHRIIPQFMAQGGCPNSKEGAGGVPGTGGPGYTIPDEIHPQLNHTGRGILSMANTGAPNSGGSQFFLCFQATPHLDGKHAVFGRVVEGLDVLDKLEAAGTPGGTPGKTIRFDVQILEKRDHGYPVQKIEETRPRMPRIPPAGK